MIDEKKIEEAAFMHTHKNQTWNEKRDYANAFKHGVEWLDLADIKPKGGEQCM
jgi:hypothetical protein|nr:MAG: hypothetical protein [Bacteriophage sp.]